MKNRSSPNFRRLLTSLCALPPMSPLLALADAPPERLQAPAVQVIGTAPLPGVERPLEQIPSNIRHFERSALDDAAQGSLPEALAARLPGVNLNETQGNPLQADVNYRGFTASPLLGTPQGLSVYIDGVRANTPFGDTVNWEMIPQVAIDSVSVIPGSNPLFGLNTLGGAIALSTRDGFRFRGNQVEAKLGSFGRWALEAEHGGNNGSTGWYLAASDYREDGWRDRSPSRAQQLFGKLSWRDARSELDLSLAHADAALTGNGLTPESMLAQRRAQVFSHPDTTWNTQSQLLFSGSHWFDETTRFSGNAYYRRSRTRTLNGDINNHFEGGANDPDTGGSGPELDNGVNHRTRTQQESRGLAGQWSRSVGAHQLALGFSLDQSRARFRQSAEIGFLDASRGVVPSEGGELEELAEPNNRLHGRTRTASVYLTDTWTLAPHWHLTAAARYNDTHIRNVDELRSAAPNLDADYHWRKLNPALGLNWQAAPALTLYSGFNQGSRTPTPIELGCADAAYPCSLPNAMAADPYLKQVVARTLEAGARGKLDLAGSRIGWSAAVYRTDNRDDLLFVGTSTSQGYFTNFGRTRRDGFELALDGSAGSVDWQMAYGWIRASFRHAACLLAENNSSRGSAPECTANGQDDEILVKPGDRLPGIPEHSLKLALRWRAGADLRLGGDLVAYAGQYLRGNENNAHGAGSATDILGNRREFSGSGRAGGYAVLNLQADYRLNAGWTLLARLNNALDRRYASGGALAENPFDSRGAFIADSGAWQRAAFLAPGAPRSVWLGVRYRLDGK